MPWLLVWLSLANLCIGADQLAAGFANPPPEAKLRAYWWWLNGNVTKEAITRDLEEMKAKGWGGALICDADGSSQDGNERVPHGPTFFSPEWRELYKHTLREANRLGLEMSLNIQSGWNLGGPTVTQDDANKKLVWSEFVLHRPIPQGAVTNIEEPISVNLPYPQARDDYYRDVCVLAFPLKTRAEGKRPELKNWQVKTLEDKIHFEGRNAWFLANSCPDTSALFEEDADVPNEEEAQAGQVLNITSKLSTNGMLIWNAPPGDWQILRFGCTIGDSARVSTSSEGWSGYALDPLDAAAFRHYWNAVVEPLIKDAGQFAGTTLKYLHTDSWEVDFFNWTPTLIEEFKKRRGYDPLPYFPTITGRIIGSRSESDRFLNDFRRTLGDLAVANHFALFHELAAKHGIGIHPESGGPHFTPVDAQQCLGINNVPMAEFWAQSRTHRVDPITRYFVKQPASAAHTYGHKFVAAEGFTTVGPHWQETIWDNLKPSFDLALCEGLNRLFWHAFVCSPKEMGVPGQQYFAGTHMNPNVTWWEKSALFIQYINRCQFMLQQGLPMADALYYYGNHVPNFTQLRSSDPAQVGNGYDYDVITEDAILSRLTVKDGLLTLPDGMSYRVLVLPDRNSISLPVLKKIQQFVADGATVIGPKPTDSGSLTDFPQCDQNVKQLADSLWENRNAAGCPCKQIIGAMTNELSYQPGRIITDKTARELLLADHVKPDFEYSDGTGAEINYIHRRTDDADIYFVANRSTNTEAVNLTFRVSGKTPEIWNAVSGEHRFASAYNETDGRTSLPLELTPYGSVFVVFRESAAKHPAHGESNTPKFVALQELNGPWSVTFDPQSRGPGTVTFDDLESWTQRNESGIKFYSGTAIYRKNFIWSQPAKSSSSAIFLDLGNVRELAEVKVNGQSYGVTWSPPFRVDITKALKPGTNALAIEVVNFWPNRIIGDASLPRDERLTKTNIRKLTANTPLMKSGLFGPVVVERQELN